MLSITKIVSDPALDSNKERKYINRKKIIRHAYKGYSMKNCVKKYCMKKLHK